MRRTPRGFYLLDRYVWVGRADKTRGWWWKGYAWASLQLLGIRVDVRFKR